MAAAPKLTDLERRRAALVLRNDLLRAQLSERCSEVTATSFWIERGYEVIQRMLANRAMLSMAFNLFRRR